MNTRTDTPLPVVAGAWLREGRLLAAKRPKHKELAGMWELPGGKVEPGESDSEALVRELHEELGVNVTVRAALDVRVVHHRRAIELRTYWVDSPDEPQALEHDELRWVDAVASADLDWGPADRAIAERVFLAVEG